jgi:hypothetical protein
MSPGNRRNSLIDLTIRPTVEERRGTVQRVNLTEEHLGGLRLSFRVILSARTRSLKPAGLRLVTNEPRKVDLMKNPKGHRRNFPAQMMGS